MFIVLYYLVTILPKHVVKACILLMYLLLFLLLFAQSSSQSSPMLKFFGSFRIHIETAFGWLHHFSYYNHRY
jgi:hypothetical protein